MLVFYIYVNVHGLHFKKAVMGSRSDYTAEELYQIRREFEKDIENKLLAMGYIG